MSNTPHIKKVPMDITKYEKNVRVALHIHRTSSAQGLLHDINAELRDLKRLESQAKGDFLYQVRELLLSNNLLATRIMKDAREYVFAYAYANDAVQVAKSMMDEDLIATARYMRGCAKAEWGRRGIIRQGMFQLDQEKIQDAILDFQKILAYAHSKPGHLHPQLEGFTKLQLSRALGMLKQGPRDRKVVQALALSDEVADVVGAEPIDDFYTRALITGTLSGLHLVCKSARKSTSTQVKAQPTISRPCNSLKSKKSEKSTTTFTLRSCRTCCAGWREHSRRSFVECKMARPLAILATRAMGVTIASPIRR